MPTLITGYLFQELMSLTRFDTTKIGFSRNRKAFQKDRTDFVVAKGYQYKKMVLKKGLGAELEQFYNRYYQSNFSSDSNTRLALIVKRFWADPFPNLLKLREQTNDMSRESNFNLFVQFEFVLNKNGQYWPLKRIDTLFQLSPFSVSSETADYMMAGMTIYEYALTRIFELPDYKFYADNFDNAKNKRSLQDLITFNNNRFKCHILQDTALNPGVYMSFAEFKANKPSVTAYRVIKDKKLGLYLYYDSPADYSKIFKYFGYCDGTNIYCGDLKFPLVKTGHTFDFFIIRKDKQNIYYPTPGTSPLVTGVEIEQVREFLEPFQIDMESGKIY